MLENLNYMDIGIIAIFVLSTVISIYRGFVREVITLCIWVLAAVLAYIYGTAIGSHFTYFDSPVTRQAVGAFIVFAVVLMVGALVKRLILKLLHVGSPSGLDRTAGAVFGLLRAVVVVVLAIVFADALGIANKPEYKKSVLVPQFKSGADYIEADARKYWQNLQQQREDAAMAPVEVIPVVVVPADTTVIIEQPVVVEDIGGTMDADGQPEGN